MDTLNERADLEDPDQVWTWCRACGTMHPLDGPYGYFRHVVLKHPRSDQARAIVEALVQVREGRK